MLAAMTANLPGRRLSPHLHDRIPDGPGRPVHLSRADPAHRRGHPLFLVLDADPQLALRPELLPHRPFLLEPGNADQQDAAGDAADLASKVLYAVLPDLENFNIKTEVVQNLPLPAGLWLGALGYSAVYTAFVLDPGRLDLPAARLYLSHGQTDAALPGRPSSGPGRDRRPQARTSTAMPRSKTPGAGIVYLPSGPAVKAATFGYPSLMADIAYVWAIQYYANPKIGDRFDHFEPRSSRSSPTSIPSWVDPYADGRPHRPLTTSGIRSWP